MRGRVASPSVVLLAGAVLFAGAPWIGAARAALPFPPRRPPEFTAPVAPPPNVPAPESAPQTPQSSSAPDQRMPVDIDPDAVKPFNLPPASRQRMRLCGERWRDLKRTGKSEGLTWRSFAEKCLPGKD
ncbi:hypothetical protein [Rhodoblastus sp.]